MKGQKQRFIRGLNYFDCSLETFASVFSYFHQFKMKLSFAIDKIMKYCLFVGDKNIGYGIHIIK